jgi:hypothetical protein
MIDRTSAFPETARPDLARSRSLLALAFAQTQTPRTDLVAHLLRAICRSLDRPVRIAQAAALERERVSRSPVPTAAATRVLSFQSSSLDGPNPEHRECCF